MNRTNDLVKITNCKLVFKCPKQWEELDITANQGIRFCHACDRGVYLAEDEETLSLLAALGKCVAFRRSEAEELDDDLFVLGVFASLPEDEDSETDRT